MPGKKYTELERTTKFWSRVNIKGLLDCWEWTGTKVGDYGWVQGSDRKGIYVHRFAWEVTYGSIPDGLWILHQCDNPPCCNPNHLYVGTPKDNAQDRERRNPRFRTKPVKVRNTCFKRQRRKEVTKGMMTVDVTKLIDECTDGDIKTVGELTLHLREKGVKLSERTLYNWQNGGGFQSNKLDLVVKTMGFKDPLEYITVS